MTLRTIEIVVTDEQRRATLVDRLRGIYTIPVDDGAGLLNGKDTFTRKFETSPINHEAAAEIDAVRAERDHWKRIAHDRLVSANQLLERARKAEWAR